MNEMSRLVQSELNCNVVLDLRRRRGRERQHGGWPEAWQALAKHSIVWAKIVTPLRYTVCLVDRNQRRFTLGQHLGKPCHTKSFWCYEEELQLATQVVGTDTVSY